jgi:hypothetical protein
MKILFLGMDGIILSGSHQINELMAGRTAQPDKVVLPEDKITNLKTIVEKTDAKIVFSNELRVFNKAFNNIKEQLTKHGIEVYGITPFIEKASKTIEIESWLKERKDIESFAILDNSTNMDQYQERIVNCPWFDGLGKEQTNRVIEILSA